MSRKPQHWHTADGEVPTSDELESLRLAGRMNAAVARINLVSRDATIDAAHAWVDKVLSIVEAGHDFLPVAHPLKEERGKLRIEFIHEAREDLNVAPLGYDLAKLSWFELQLMRVPRLRQRMANRALIYDDWRPELESRQ